MKISKPEIRTLKKLRIRKWTNIWKFHQKQGASRKHYYAKIYCKIFSPPGTDFRRYCSRVNPWTLSGPYRDQWSLPLHFNSKSRCRTKLKQEFLQLSAQGLKISKKIWTRDENTRLGVKQLNDPWTQEIMGKYLASLGKKWSKKTHLWELTQKPMFCYFYLHVRICYSAL